MITVDTRLLFRQAIGEAGLPDDTLDTLGPRLTGVHAALHARVDSGELPFLSLHEDTALVERVAAYAHEVKGRFTDCVVLGIGGSSLGGRALVGALGGAGMRTHFPDNLDPDTFGDLLCSLDLERTVFNAISKSGGTLETLAQLLIVRERLVSVVGAERLRDHLVLTTDPQRGFLRQLATEENLVAWEVPPGVGGRFSALTAVGLVPAALGGVDPAALYRGAAWAAEAVSSPDPTRNPALMMAGLLYAMDRVGKRSILFTVPYADALRPLAEWFAQLWAESLGKGGRGPTPVTAVGATDQHSQLQLWMEGPPNAVIGFVELERFRTELQIPSTGLGARPEVSWFAGRDLSHVLRTEKRATERALADAGRPSFTWRVPELSPESVAAMMVLMEAMTAYAGGLYGIDPFDQPGVEAGKVLTRQLMG